MRNQSPGASVTDAPNELQKSRTRVAWLLLNGDAAAVATNPADCPYGAVPALSLAGIGGQLRFVLSGSEERPHGRFRSDSSL